MELSDVQLLQDKRKELCTCSKVKLYIVPDFHESECKYREFAEKYWKELEKE